MLEAKASDSSFGAFKDCVDDIIKALPQNMGPSDAAARTAVRSIASQIKDDYKRLQYVIEKIKARICEDNVWASFSAMSVYELLAASVDPKISHPDSHIVFAGSNLVRLQMISACQTQFHQTITTSNWSRGLITFLEQTCNASSPIRTTVKITVDTLDRMFESGPFTNDENFDIFVGFFMCAGSFLDGLGCQNEVVIRLEKLIERSKSSRTSHWLATYGLSQLRRKGWSTDEVKDD